MPERGKKVTNILGKICTAVSSLKAVKCAPTAKHHLKIMLVITTCNERKNPTFSSDCGVCSVPF